VIAEFLVSRYLVLGSEGQIGSSVRNELQSGAFEVTCADIQDLARPDYFRLDLTQDQISISADVGKVIFCSSPPYRSDNPNLERFLNGAMEFVTRYSDRNIPILFLSTSYVFDGTIPFPGPETVHSPIDLYGRHKAAIENVVLRYQFNSVLRITKVIGPQTPPFKNWVSELQAGRKIEAFANFRIAPVPLSLVVKLICELTTRDIAGLFQLSADDEISFKDVISYIAKKLDLDDRLVGGVDADPKAFPRVGLSAGLKENVLPILGRKNLPSLLALDEFVADYFLKNPTARR
jgi:dTDP-4-dehydrorhamnose reductase